MSKDAGVAGPDFTKLSRAPLPSLTGLRWIGAVGVFFYHATGPYMFPDGVFNQAIPFALRNVGALALSFFFILTGFVMTWSVRPTDTARRFWGRRIVKLFPNHILTWAIMLYLLDFVPNLWPNRIGATGVWQSFFMLQAWSPNPYTTIGVNAVSWSLSVDAFFLFMFPLFMRGLNRIRPEKLWYWLFGTLALIIAVPFIATLLPYQPMLPTPLVGIPTSQWQWWFIYDCPLTRSLECVLGAFTARLLLTGRCPKLRVRTALAVTVVIYTGGVFLPINFYGIVAISVIPMLLMTVALVQNDIRGHRSFLGSRIMIWFGSISYAFYLLHRIVLETLVSGLLKNVHWSTPAGFGMILAILALTIGLARLLYVFVERPLVRRFSPPDHTGRQAGSLGLDGARTAVRTGKPLLTETGEPVVEEAAEPEPTPMGENVLTETGAVPPNTN
jgi:peptidoglycan/LPS O-acetylase OafA/YrhL